MKQAVSSLIILILLVMVGCASNQLSTNSYNALSIAATTYETSMSAVEDLLDQGVLDEEDRVDIKKYATTYWAAYHTAVDALSTYNQVKDKETKEALIKAKDELLLRSSEFKERIDEIEEEVL